MIKIHRFFALSALLIAATLPVFAEKIVLDVKTKMLEKLELAPIVAGLDFLILESKTFALLDVGEDYSIWLGGYSRERIGDAFRIRLRVDLAPPSAFLAKAPLTSEEISFELPADRPESFTTEDSATRFIREKVQRVSAMKLAESMTGAPLIMKRIEAMIARVRK